MHINWLAIIGFAWIPVVVVIGIYLLLKKMNILNTLALVKIITVVTGGVTLTGGLIKAWQCWFAQRVHLTIYAREFWPEPPKWIFHTSNAIATVTGGGFTKAEVWVDGLGAFPRTMLAIDGLAFAAVVLIACWQAYEIVSQIQKGQEFRQQLSKRFAWSGVTIIVVGMLGQVASMLGTNYAALDVFGTISSFGWKQAASGVGADLVPNPFVSADGMGISNNMVVGIVQSGPGAGLEFWPVAAGLILLVLARVFKRGQELADDAEGLV